MLAAAGTASAQLLFFDDFSQFTNGTVFTETNYMPGVWSLPATSANIWTNTPGSVTASNLLGSIRLFFDAPSNPGGDNAGYSPELANGWGGTNLTAFVTNGVVDVQWLSWIANTHSSSHMGGLSVDIESTNLNTDCESCVFQSAPLVFYADSGAVYAFTNDPNNGVGPLPIVQIGTWSSHVGTIMTNRLVLNYPASTFSVSLNGVMLTNSMVITHYFTNILTEVDFGAAEFMSTSAGNKFALDNVQIVVSNANRDVSEFIVAGKGQMYNQTSTNTPSLIVPGCVFHSEVQAVTTNSVLDARVHFLNGSKTNLTQDSSDSSYWAFDNPFASQTILDTNYINGVYRLSILGRGQGFFDSSLTLSGDSNSYPNIPQISNFDAAQTIGANTNFTLQWNSSGNGTGDWVMLEVDDESGSNTVLSTPNFGETNALRGTNTSLVITGGTLQALSTYQGQLVFAHPIVVDTNTIPGAVGAIAYFMRTDFALTTVVPPVIVDVSLAKNAGTTTVSAGDTGTFTVTAHNNGTNTATGVTVTDTLPDGLLFKSASVSGGSTWTNSGNVVTMSTASLGVGNAATLTLSATAVDTGSVCNAATLTTTEYNTNSTKTANVCITVNPVTADVYVLKNQDKTTVGSGSNLTYTITVGNHGSGTATSVHLVDAVPTTGATVLSNSTTLGTITNSGNVVTVDIPVLSNGVSGTVTIWTTANTPALQSIQLTNTVTVSSQASDSVTSNNTAIKIATVNPPPSADLALAGVSGVVTASLNNAFTYTFTVTNNGPNSATSAQLVDTLPSGLVFSSATSGAGTCTNVGGVVTCNFSTLASGTVATASITVTAAAPGSVCNTATVTNTLTDPVTANNSTTICTPVVINNLAVTAFTAPKKVVLSVSKPSVAGKFSVTIQNRSNHTETIANMAMLNNLVTVTLLPIGTNTCSLPVIYLVLPKTPLPIALAAGKTLKLAYTNTFICATDPLATKTVNHNDYQYVVTVHHTAINGQPDSYAADDTCPHNAVVGAIPYTNGKIKDKGCGLKIKGAPTGTFTNVVTDIIDTSP